MNRTLADRGICRTERQLSRQHGFVWPLRGSQNALGAVVGGLDSAAAARMLGCADVDAHRIVYREVPDGGLITAQSLARYSNSPLQGRRRPLWYVNHLTFSSDNSGRWDPSCDFGVFNADGPRPFNASPVRNLDTWKSPVLLMTGDDDIYLDVRHTIDLAQRLREHGIAVQTVMKPDESSMDSCDAEKR